MKSVLIVDDAAFMRLALRMLLEKNNYVVAGEADNGFDAIEEYKKYHPDIVTMDITMPKMTGLEAVKEIIKIDRNAKIIMISSMGQETHVKEAILSGAKNFIIKPYKEEHVLKTLCKL